MLDDCLVAFLPRFVMNSRIGHDRAFGMHVVLCLAGLTAMGFAGCGDKREDSPGQPSGSVPAAMDGDKSTEETLDEEGGGSEENSEDEKGKDNEAGEDEGSGGGLGVLPGLSDEPTKVTIAEPWNSKNFDLVLTGPSETVKGEDSRLVLTLTPGKPYQINKLFPFSLEIKNVSDGLDLPAKSFKKNDAAVFDSGQAVYHLDLKGTEEGTQSIDGLFSFSVCTPKFCETPKARVSAEIMVMKKTGKKTVKSPVKRPAKRP